MSEPISFADFVALRRDTWIRAACLLTGDPHTAEDLVQTALVRVWPRWRRVSAQGDADGYVRTVLMNVFLTSLRRRRWREVSVDPGEMRSAMVAAYGAGESDTIDARLDLKRELSSLAPRQRAVVVLRYYFDLSEAETASTLGCSIGAVKSQAAKGVSRLRGNVQTSQERP